MAENTKWQEKYEYLVGYIERERDYMARRSSLAFRQWQYEHAGATKEDYVCFDCVLRELDVVLSVARMDFDEDEEE